MEDKRTVEDVILEAMNVLNNLTVPIALVETLGLPIALVSANLKSCLDAFEAERKKAAAAEQGGEAK